MHDTHSTEFTVNSDPITRTEFTVNSHPITRTYTPAPAPPTLPRHKGGPTARSRA